jgi:signal transduction histidine kinase/pSer/pThr/pTyr-binding forkhead associated (FHA) protein
VPSLFVIRGNDQGTRFELDEPVMALGRESSNRIQIHDTEVSRQHAELRRSDNVFSITDLNSSNGTFVNGVRLQHHRLASGDQIQLGGTLMLYTGPSESPEEDLSSKVDITSCHASEDKSHIIHSVPHQEGNDLLAMPVEVPPSSWLSRARSSLQVIYRTAVAISHTLDIDQLLQRIMDLIFESVEADRGCVMLLSADSQTLTPKVRRTRKGVQADEKLKISKTILDYVLDRKEGVLTTDAKDDERWNPAASIVQLGIREAICVPMQGRYGVVGVIYIDTSSTPQELIRKGGTAKFTEDHLKLMIAIAHQAALAVEDTRYYSAMVQAERLAAVGQTIATVSHHIKNILQGIRGGSYLIEVGLTEHDETLVRKGWGIVDKNQNKISNLVLDMLTFSKEREPDLHPSEINQVVSDVVELMHARAEESHIDLAWQPGETIPTLVFDPEGLHRAVLNVVTNAFDAVAERQPGEGRVEIVTEYAQESALVRVLVTDNGPGIAPEQRTTLFTAFVSTKKSRGTGLGLPVTQKILKEHGGQVLVDSVVGQGSRFILEWPAVLPGSGPQTILFTPENPEAHDPPDADA